MSKSPLSLALTLALLSPAAMLTVEAHAASGGKTAPAKSAAASVTTASAASTTAGKPELGSFGIDLTAADHSVKPGDDFARYTGGHWIDTYELRDYDVSYGSFNALRDRSEEQVNAIVKGLQSRSDLKPGSDEQKVRDYYASYMDQAARDAAGIKPIAPILHEIDEIDSVEDLTKQFGRENIDASNSPLSVSVSVDRKDPSRYMASLGVGGLGLPDKDYYFNTEARYVAIRAAYVKHIAGMLGFAGVPAAEATKRAEAVLALETTMAKTQWDRAERRDRDKTYNPMTWDAFVKAYPGYDWNAHLKAQGTPTPEDVNVSTPSSVAPAVALVTSTPLATWKDYLRFNAVSGNAAFLSKQIDEANFAFNGTVLSGAKAQKEPWKRAVATVASTNGLGDAVGKIYVAEHFSPASKAAMDELVANLRAALRQNIDKLDWMGPATKTEAYHKLDTFNPKIGYAKTWRDYSTVKIDAKDLMGNVIGLRKFYNDDQNARYGTKPDRDEWFMTPQTVNAYYNSQFNEVVFPAGILQAPFFDINADAAVNYGGIGAVIGHEMGHGFDDQGSKSDFAGIQRQWWTAEDRAKFETRTKALGAQYDSYCPIAKTCVNGSLTMGENIGDLGGMSMALTAYHMSLKGKPAPVIDGLTGDQRFFLAWAQVWKNKMREEALVNQIKTNPHSPPEFRINGPVRNVDAWYTAFDVKPGDKLYLAPADRVHIW
ncbi:MAG: M13 family metallopeptidase [Pseudoxanthomonas sp.]